MRATEVLHRGAHADSAEALKLDKTVDDYDQAIPKHHRGDWVTVVDSFAALAH